MSWRVPGLDVVLRPPGPRHRHQALLVDPRVAGLVEGADAHVEPGIFPAMNVRTGLLSLPGLDSPDDLVGVLVRVEAVHQDQGHVGVVPLVEELDLLDGEVEEGEVVPHGNDRLGAAAAHAGAETSVELDDDKLIQHGLDGLAGTRLGETRVGQDLEMGLRGLTEEWFYSQHHGAASLSCPSGRRVPSRG